MAKLFVLGSSNAIPSRDHGNTQLALITADRRVLVDCGSNPVVPLEQCGLDPVTITDIILTHFHPDHAAGLPLLLMNMWLMGRRSPLTIHGLAYTLDRAEAMMALFGWQEWPGLFAVKFSRVPEEELAVLLDDSQVRIYASPVKHFLPNIGLRFELKAEHKSLAYSSDTEPCQALLELARDVDVLIHEASGPFPGHSSAAQAAELAARVGAGELYLIHYPTGRFASGDLLAEAAARFPGRVQLAVDLMKIELTGSA